MGSETTTTAPRYAPLTSLPHLRTTGFRAFERCPRTWAESALRADGGVETRSSRIGHAVHSIVEHSLKSSHGLLDAAGGEGAGGQVEAMMAVPPAERDALVEYVGRLHELPVVDCLGVELTFVMDVPGVGLPVKGTIDYLAELENGELLIVDHKTNRRHSGVRHWSQDIQPLVYAMWVRQGWPGRAVRYMIGHVNMPDELDVEWLTDPADDAATAERLALSWQLMRKYEREGLWPATANDKCEWCPVFKECPQPRHELRMLRDDAASRLAPMSVGERLEYVTAVRKIAEGMEAALKEELLEACASGPVVQGATEWSSTEATARHIDPAAAFMVLGAYAVAVEGDERKALMSALPALLTAKVGGLTAKGLPRELRSALEGLVEVRQTGCRLKSKPAARERKTIGNA